MQSARGRRTGPATTVPGVRRRGCWRRNRMKPVLHGSRRRSLAAAAVATAGALVTLVYGVSTVYISLETTHGAGWVVPVLAGCLAVVLMAVGVVLLSRAVARGADDR